MAYNRKLLYTKSVPSWNTPSGDLGSYSQNDNPITPIQLSASNDPQSEITYEVITGALPNGLNLSLSGEISGTLTGYSSDQTINFSIKATDSEGEFVERSFFISITGFVYNVDYLVVAAGGGGGGVGGGGGAGGYRSSYGNGGVAPVTVYGGNIYTINVGAGGTSSATNAPWNYDGGVGSSGGNSTFHNITSLGGGGGAGAANNALNGGSGGGSRSGSPGSGTAGQGNNGGNNANVYIGGGGGGATQAGNTVGQNGGNGASNSITGTATYYAGGGGGGGSSSGGAGGLGGGGGGSAGAGTPNTGGGGAGGSWTNNGNLGVQKGGNGGSGVVILRMPTLNYTGVTTGSPTVTTSGSDTILTYTGSGTYTA